MFILEIYWEKLFLMTFDFKSKKIYFKILMIVYLEI